MPNELTREQQKELQKLTDELADISIRVIEDYKLNPSEMSGSITQVHIDSPNTLTRTDICS